MRPILASLFLLFFSSFLFAQGNRFYVDAYSTGGNDGSSWHDAFTDLQSALFAAQPGDCIWVALGTYKPTDNYDRDTYFNLKKGVQLYGGFSGIETKLEQRDWERFKTVLSGNIGRQDDSADNSYTILYIENPNAETFVDGFIFTGGKADKYDPSSSAFSKGKCGGAIYVLAEDSTFPGIRNCTFEHNHAIEQGAAVFMSVGEGKQGLLPLENCWFTNNRSEGQTKQAEASTSAFRVYPNPTTETVTVEGEVKNATLPLYWSLFDTNGKLMQTIEIQDTIKKISVQIPLAGLPAGWYNFQMADNNGAILDAGKLWKQ